MAMPSPEKLTKAELKELEKKVNDWRDSKLGREIVKTTGKKTVRHHLA